MNKFFDLNFWFDIRPSIFTGYSIWLFLGLALVGIILGFIALYLQKKYRQTDKISMKIWKKLSNLGFSFGIVELILMFFKQQRAPYLGMRIWLFLWIIISLVWLVFILKYIFKTVPQLRAEKQRQADLKKYLP